jgi:8-oxo-dGTP pyrophosphatase MutT (NUDIX family)
MRQEFFCNEGTVVLTDSVPETLVQSESILEYSGKKDLKARIAAFEKSNPSSTLYVYSQDKADEMTQAFFSFHRLVQAAGGIVFNEHDEILFIHRNGKWDLPKGKISQKDWKKAGKNGESNIKKNQVAEEDSVARIAAIREVREETGLKKLYIQKELPSTYHVYFRGEQSYLKHTRWFKMTGSSDERIVPQVEEGIIIARWIPSNTIGCVFKHTYESLKPLIRCVIEES